MTPGDVVAMALAELGPALERIGSHDWRLTLSNGTATAVRARVDEGWLVLDARHHGPPARAWSLLEWNGALPAGVRLAQPAGSPDVLVRAEVALDPAADPGHRIAEAWAGLEAAARRLASAASGEIASATSADGDDTERLAALCRDTGWPVRRSATGVVLVELDAPGAFHQAVVTAPAAGLVRVAVPVLESEELSSVSDTRRGAVALLLLRVGAVVRLARAIATAGEPAAPGFETVLTRPDAVDLAHAFGALSVACRLAAPAAEVLSQDEAVATLYLRQGRGSVVRAAA